MARDALPTYDRRDASLSLVYWGATASHITTSGTLLGQVQSFQWTDTLTNRDSYRVGDSARYRVYTGETVDWTLSLYEDNDIAEIAKIFGTSKPTAGGYTASTSVDLDTTNSSVTVVIANFNGEGTGSTLLWTETLTGVYLESVQRPDTSNEQPVWQFTGVASEVTIQPVAGMGA